MKFTKLPILTFALFSLVFASSSYAKTLRCERYQANGVSDFFGNNIEAYESWYPKILTIDAFDFEEKSGSKSLVRESTWSTSSHDNPVIMKYTLFTSGKLVAKASHHISQINGRYECDMKPKEILAIRSGMPITNYKIGNKISFDDSLTEVSVRMNNKWFDKIHKSVAQTNSARVFVRRSKSNDCGDPEAAYSDYVELDARAEDNNGLKTILFHASEFQKAFKQNGKYLHVYIKGSGGDWTCSHIKVSSGKAAEGLKNVSKQMANLTLPSVSKSGLQSPAAIEAKKTKRQNCFSGEMASCTADMLCNRATAGQWVNGERIIAWEEEARWRPYVAEAISRGLDCGVRETNTVEAAATEPTTIGASNKMTKAEEKCTSLGFTAGTEKHGDCVMKLLDY